MKKYILFVVFVNVCIPVFSIDFSVFYYDGIRITDTKLYYYPFDENGLPEEYDITWERINNNEYITFNYTGNFMDSFNQFHYQKSVPKGIKRYLILYGVTGDNDYLFLYDSNNELTYIQSTRLTANAFVPQYIVIKATSELQEGNITYSAENLLKEEKLLPWAEGVKGAGIGEKIYIERNSEGTSYEYLSKWKIFGIAISNGYVDYNKPYLYEYNNRVKKIRVHYEGLNEYIDIEVQDTPQIQYFRLDKLSGKIQIEILEVYKGEKWDDTCINSISTYADFW